MDAKQFLTSKERGRVEEVANKAGTSFAYLKQIAYGCRNPSVKLCRKLVDASDGELTLEELRPDIFGSDTAAA